MKEDDFTDEQIDEFLSKLINELDYDIWKELYRHGDDEDAIDTRYSLSLTVREWLQNTLH